MGSAQRLSSFIWLEGKKQWVQVENHRRLERSARVSQTMQGYLGYNKAFVLRTRL